MTIGQDQVKNLWRKMPNRKTVTYYVRQADDTFGAGATVTDCESRPLKDRDFRNRIINSDRRQRVWHLWTEKLGGTEPRAGDKLTDPDGVTWFVDEVDLELMDVRFRCLCTREV